ncbi:MAG: hypothetical protein UY52_C0025G0005 [Parcubacteria group bacterium GW2011_GWC2_49_9]|nr:MAG: hypothetical protein UY34_C0012G0017 [Parcubacteria group bacterium GW2011_GWA2_48_9]KKW14543.1 MAG: hypothetical protein UY52_C0025G0005 [Parcubacteria group bacterium GW2011_GWC2_49_9]
MQGKAHQRYWPNQTTYFLTGSTFLHFPYFRSIGQKYLVLRQIGTIQKRFNLSEVVYSISINHYHMKFFLDNGLDLAKVKQIMHGGTSYIYRKQYGMWHKEMWQSQRTLVVTSEAMDQKVTGYIIGNLLKHKEVSTFHELAASPFSSYGSIARKYGDEYARRLVSSIIDVSESSEGQLDTRELNSHTLN